MVVATTTALAFVAFMCALGLFSRAFKDNWLQHIGLLVTGLWAAFEAINAASGDRSPNLLVAVGLACYAGGTAIKAGYYAHVHWARDQQDFANSDSQLSTVRFKRSRPEAE